MNKSIGLFFILIAFLSTSVSAQETNYTLAVDEILSIPKKQSFDQEIVSASKKAESLFTAPLAASVLTYEEIKASGATNIMEAIRLIPGVIVRQMTNGVYNIHLRGMDWLPHIAEEDVLAGVSRLALVMIDGRPVYNYVLGSTYWETLPISISDVERIEVIRGPAASLYGPNAVTGVINIITKEIQEDGAYAIVNTQVGSYNTNILNGALGYQPNSKFNVMVSANREYRERTHDLYYNKSAREYTAASDISYLGGILTGQEAADFFYPDSEVSLKKESVNAMIHYTPNTNFAFSVRGGLENTQSNKVLFPDFDTFLNKFTSKTQYIDANAEIYNGTLKASYRQGDQNAAVGILYGQELEFGDIEASYDFNFIKGLTLTPSFGYRSASYWHPIDQTEVLDSPEKALNAVLANFDPSLPPEAGVPLALAGAFAPPFGIITETSSINNLAFGFRADYLALNDKLRIIGAIRADRFTNLNNKYYYSYQFSTSYSISETQFFRLGISRSNASQFLLDTQITLAEPATVSTQFGDLPAFRITRGNKNIDLINQTSVEIGYRVRFSNKLTIDLEAFRGVLRNQHSSIKDSVTLQLNAPIPHAVIWQNFKDLPHEAIQTGFTLSINYIHKNLWFKPFITYQDTKVKNYSFIYATEDFVNQYPSLVPNLNTGIEDKSEINHEATPSFYGGFYLNYKLLGKLNLNVNSYFMGNQIMRRNLGDGSNFYETGERIITNFRVGYDLNKQATVFFSLRDLSNDSEAEYFYTDPIRTMYFFGLNYQLK